jgi:hypothetical protein
MSRGEVAVYLDSSFNLGTKWEFVINATLRPLYVRESDLDGP